MNRIIWSLLIISVFFSKNMDFNYIAKVYIDGVNTVDYQVKNNKIIKRVYFYPNAKSRSEITHRYTGEKITGIIINDKLGLFGSNKDFELKYFQDAITHEKTINNKFKIYVPLQTINTDEVSNIAYLLNSISTRNIQKETNRYISAEPNMRYRFYPSELEKFIFASDVIKKFELQLKKDTLTSEKYIFSRGTLIRDYIWINKKELQIKISCKYTNGSNEYSIKRIILNKD